MALHYRTEIEGLRALAVLPIVLFHAGVSSLGGGFVGVDIFFVISGYLITSIILNEAAKDQFTLLGFYRRRVVRIFPALFVMLLATLAAGCAIMLPLELRSLGESAIATSAFVANFYFYFTIDYFAGSAETQPLLHTWSLGVEEQFYVVYPLALIALTRYRPHWTRAALWAVTLVSLAIGAALVVRKPEAAFYLLPSRAWELALGGLVATGAFPAIARREIATVAGCLLIAVSIVAVRSDAGFPVPWGIAPCLGAALIIAYGENTACGRLLSASPIRSIGVLSYSLYLWHWPIIALYRLEFGIELDRGETVLLLLASLAAAALSYVLVERPFLRRYRAAPAPRAVVTGLAGALGVIAAGGVVWVNADNWRPHDPRAMAVAQYVKYRETPLFKYQFRPGPCFRTNKSASEAADPGHCMTTRADKPNLMVVGDSHAAQFWRAFTRRYPDWNVIQATASHCRPVLGGSGAKGCRKVVDHALGPVLATGRIDTVVLAGRWREEDLPRIAGTIAHIRKAGARVMVIGPTVEYQGEFPAILARAMIHGDQASLANYRERLVDRLDSELAAIVGTTDATYVSLVGMMCSTGPCRTIAPGGAPMQFDYGHLTLPASEWVVARTPRIVASRSPPLDSTKPRHRLAA